MEPNARDDGLQRERPPHIPTDVTADKPQPTPPDYQLRDVDVRGKGRISRRTIFALAGAGSGAALVLLCSVVCNTQIAPDNGLPPGVLTAQDVAFTFEGCCLLVSIIIGSVVGLVCEMIWRPRPPRPH